MSTHSLVPIEVTSTLPVSPSISSSRRTSVDTQTRSSTVGSPALGPVSTISGGSIGASGSANQLASARRNRAALRDFYGLKSPSAQKDVKDGKEQESETEVQPGELDNAGFDAKAYVKELLGKESLERLLKTEGSLVSEIRSLDGDRKALVYDNYSKLITATETIRRMRANMDPLTPTTSTLAPAISHIADTAEKLSSAIKSKASIGPNLKIGDTNADKTISEERKNKVATVQWACSAPKRYRKLIAKGDREIAEKDWSEVKGVLDIWQKQGILGAAELLTSCEEIFED